MNITPNTAPTSSPGCGPTRIKGRLRKRERMMPATYDLTFLRELAHQPKRERSEAERQAMEAARQALVKAGAVVALLGGRSGRLGECVVGTALLESALLALRALGRAGTPVRIVVDSGAAAGLFGAAPYKAAYWPDFAIVPMHAGDTNRALDRALASLDSVSAHDVLVLDLHGDHDGMPALLVEDAEDNGDNDAPAVPHRITTLARLFRVGIRDYAERGSLRRYADVAEDLFGLPRDTIDGRAAQPTLRLSDADAARYPALARRLGLRPGVPLVVCFFQSVVAAKCYTRWDEALSSIFAGAACDAPGRRFDILIACGPDDAAHPPGATQADLAATFGAFRGTDENASVTVTITPSLRDLAILVSRAVLVLADDTGPGHIAGALGIPTVTPFLPGNVYSKRVWSSSRYHHGVTLDPSPFTFEQIRDAVLWDSTHVIDSIPPDALASAAAPILARLA